MGRQLFGAGKVFIGVVHLPPLPGSPRWGGDLAAVLGQAEEEALALERGGANGIIVENFGDPPFRIGPVPPETVATPGPRPTGRSSAPASNTKAWWPTASIPSG
jgi:hypothetical protein